MGRPKGSLNRATIEKMQAKVDALESGEDIPETDEEIFNRISKRFRVLESNILGPIAHGKGPKSVIISGAPGCGKTYTVEEYLREGETRGHIKPRFVTGAVSAVGLFAILHDVKQENGVVLFDDCDSILYDQEGLNILKGALDMKKIRTISWHKKSKYLEDLGVPNDFEFYGTAIFATNINIKREVDRNTKLAPHLAALVDRSVYMDLGIHTKREIFVRLAQVMEETTFLEDNNLTEHHGEMIMAFIAKHMVKFRTVSIRTAIKIGDFIKQSPSNWNEIAEVTLFSAD